MARDSILSKVRKLIALTSSSHEEEARSAALRAAKLIREHNLEITDPTDRPAADQQTWPRWTYIVSRYPGRCIACGDFYDPGERIQWKKGVGCIHEDCERPA